MDPYPNCQITALLALYHEEEITKDQYKQAVYWVRRVRI